jgi:uncharacterized membrane protein
MAAQVFISYSHEDHEFVSRLALDLEDRGADVWIDRMDLHAGTEWRERISQGVKDCTVFVPVVSPESLQSEWASRELDMAIEYDKPVLPLLYRPARLPERLSRYQYINFRRGSYEQNLADLVAQLARHGVAFRAVGPDEIARRDRERLLGTPPPTRWGMVLRKIPGWALAWAIGWLVVWTVVFFVLVLIQGSSGSSDSIGIRQLPLVSVSGSAGGFAGGLVAGLFTMLALRHNAPSVGWKHQSLAIRVWAVGGTIAFAVFIGIVWLFLNRDVQSTSVDCSGLNLGECFQASVGQAVGDVIGQVCLPADRYSHRFYVKCGRCADHRLGGRGCCRAAHPSSGTRNPGAASGVGGGRLGAGRCRSSDRGIRRLGAPGGLGIQPHTRLGRSLAGEQRTARDRPRHFRGRRRQLWHAICSPF